MSEAAGNPPKEPEEGLLEDREQGEEADEGLDDGQQAGDEE